MAAQAATKEKPDREKAREPVTSERTPERERAREPARAGGLSFTHPITGEVLTRDPIPSGSSQYHIPKELIPDGMVYQWRRKSTLGEPDLANISNLKRNGWREVPADRHPEYPVELEGLVLMECPEMFVAQSRAEERQAAMAEKMKQRRPRNEATLAGYFDDQSPAAARLNFAKREVEASDPALRPSYSRQVDIDS